jgi:predicted Zn-dependent protease
VFAAGGDAVVDVCHRRAWRVEAAADGDGAPRIAAGERAELDARLVGEGGRHLEVRLGDPAPDEVEARLALARSWLPTADPDPDFRVAPHPDRTPCHLAPGAFADPRGEGATAALSRLMDDLRGRIAARIPGDVAARPRIRSVIEVEEMVVADAEGLWRAQTLPRAWFEVEVEVVRGRRSGRFCARGGERGGLEALVAASGAAEGPRAAAEQAADRALALLGARPLADADRRRVGHLVLHPSALAFLVPAFARAFGDEAIDDGSSELFRPDRRHRVRRAGVPHASIVDGPLAGARPFATPLLDDEGVAVAPVALIDAGVPGVPFGSRTHGRTPAGRVTAGRGGRHVVGTDTWLVPADARAERPTLDALLAGIELGLWLEGADGAEAGPESVWSRIQLARIVRDGRLTDEVAGPCHLHVRPRLALGAVEAFHGPPGGATPCWIGERRPAGFGGPITRLRLTDAFAVVW